MAYNEAGIITKQKLITSAKRLFYTKGFHKTTLKEISEDAKIPRSNLFYYYKNKCEIAAYLTNDINNRFFGFVNEEFEKHHYNENLIVKSCTVIAAFFLSIMSDYNLNRFYSELYLNNVGLIPGNEFYISVFRTMYKACKKDIHGLEFRFFYIYNTSSQGEFLRQYMTRELPATKIEAVRFFLDQLLMGLSIEEGKRKLIIENAIELSQKLNVKYIDVFWIPYFESNNAN